MRSDTVQHLDPWFAASPRRSIVRDDDEEEEEEEEEADGRSGWGAGACGFAHAQAVQLASDSACKTVGESPLREMQRQAHLSGGGVVSGTGVARAAAADAAARRALAPRRNGATRSAAVANTSRATRR